MARLSLYFLLLSVLLGIIAPPLYSAAATPAPEVPSSPEASAMESGTLDSSQEENKAKLSSEQKSSLITFFTWSQSLPQELAKLKISMKNQDYDQLLEKMIPMVTADIRDLQWEVATVNTAPYLLRVKINQFQRQLSTLQQKIIRYDAELAADVASLSTLRNEWLDHRNALDAYQASERHRDPDFDDKFSQLAANIDEALKIIETALRPALLAGKDFADLHVRLQLLDADIRQLATRYDESRLLPTSPTPLSVEFYRQLSLPLLIDTLQSAKTFLLSHVQILRDNVRSTALTIVFVIIAALLIGTSRALVLPSSSWYSFATCPFATTIIIVTTVRTGFHNYFNIPLESQWSLILNVVTILAVIRLIKHCINQEWKRVLFTRISLYLLVTLVLAALKMPQILMLVFVLSASLAALVIYISSLKATCRSTMQKVLKNCWGILPVAILVMGLAGYDQLAIFVFTNSISSIGVGLAIWMLFLLNSGVLELLLKLVPFGYIRDHIPVIVKSLQPLIAALHIMLFIAVLCVSWDIYPSTDIAFEKMFNSGYDFAGIHVSPGFLLSILLVLYGSQLVSRATQALLLTEVLPHYSAEKGVQLSIARLVHYGILTIGFIVLLKVLGFELRQLTILGGALGVGIGFGLQAIVNNFVGGLILLFERPIKVGDTIQVGTELGEVKNLGLRATIIQTFDNAEIVVPNSDLITGQVTNWTLAERKARVRIPVGVAYGTDVSKVLEILRGCALSHPMVLSSPAPTALFLAFGASSLDFELRFWIPEYLDKMTATSEMNQSIESEFAEAGIEIPFPQHDLHIRSISELAVRSWRGPHVDTSTGAHAGLEPAVMASGGDMPKENSGGERKRGAEEA